MDEIDLCTSHTKALKTNCSNTLRKFFYKPEEESVTKLGFFNEKIMEKPSFMNIKQTSRSKENNMKVEFNCNKLYNEKKSKYNI